MTMTKKPRFGAAIPQDEWIQRTVTTDPNPRMPFSNGIAGSPGTEPTMTKTERFLCGLVFGFAIGVIFLVPWP